MPVRSGALSRGLLGLLFGFSLAACAGKDQPRALIEPGDAAAPAGAESEPLIQLAEEQDADDDYDDGAVKDVVMEEDAGGDGELDLAAYERLLVAQELRLRSAQNALSGGDEVASKSEPSGGSHGGLVGAPSQEPSPSPPRGVGKITTSKPKTSKNRKNRKNKKNKKNKPSNGGGSGYGAGRASPSRTPSEAPSCVTICDIAKTTCDLERRICDLASRHPDEERYAQVCQRASDDCELAQSACESCMV